MFVNETFFSCYYHSHDNFLVYGAQGMKNDFGGHDNFHFNNMYAYVGAAIMLYCTQYNGHEDFLYNNSVVMYQDGVCHDLFLYLTSFHSCSCQLGLGLG